jgi:hypothetical protein
MSRDQLHPIAALVLVATALGLTGAGCQLDAAREPHGPDSIAGPAGGRSAAAGIIHVDHGDTQDLGPFGDLDVVSEVFSDVPSWSAWNVRRPAQTWSQDSAGIKWMSFEPDQNHAVSPAFDGVLEFRVELDVFLPPGFPVFGADSAATGAIVQLASFDPAEPQAGASSNLLAIDLIDGQHWRIGVTTRDGATGESSESGDTFEAPWIFEHGWNRVEWTVLIREGAGNDAMRLRVGDRIVSWIDADIALPAAPIRHVVIGPWSVARGDRYLAIRNLRVEALAPLPDDPPPPGDPPPGDPPPPGEPGLVGGNALSGFWGGWAGRHRMGTRFESHGSYGTMSNNTNAGTRMGLGERGWFECEIYYDTEIHPGEGGGQHLIGVFSQSASRAGPYDPSLDHIHLTGFLRLDLAVRENQLYGVIYEEIDGRITTFAIGTYDFVAWHRWAPLRVEWEQQGTRLWLSINGDESVHTVRADANPIGNLLFVGNMDRNSGERCVGANDPCGLLGEVRFRDFRWGTR